MNHQAIQEMREIVERELAPARVVDFDVSEDVDHDGDAILRIKVVFAAENGRLDPRGTIGLPRHFREPLERLDIDAFPIFRFLSEGDAAGAAA